MSFQRFVLLFSSLAKVCKVIVVADGVPEDFECAWRVAAFDFGRSLLPRHGFGFLLLLEEALELKNCTGRTSFVAIDDREEARREEEVEEEAIFVSPGESLQDACDEASRTKLVRLRSGVHRLESSLVLTSRHSGLQIVGDDGAEVSGGVELTGLRWEEVKNGLWATKIDLEAHSLDDVTGLQINGRRRTVARYPNQPGGIEKSCFYGCEVPGTVANWTGPTPPKSGPKYYRNDSVVRNDSDSFRNYQIGFGGTCSIFDPPVSYWCSENPEGGGAVQFRMPSGVVLPDGFGNSPYSKPPRFHVYRPNRWANWMFDAEPSLGDNNYTFVRGGYQGARGDDFGGDFHVENVIEELDDAEEFYFDGVDTLYLVSQVEPPTRGIVVPRLRVLVNVTGTRWRPVSDVSLRNIKFTATHVTYMDPHGIPSGGDWALERQAAVFAQGTSNFTVSGCAFVRLDSGNALMFSGFNRNSKVLHSDFAFLGGTAIALWGFTNETEYDPARPYRVENAPEAGLDATDGEHPVGTVVSGCLIHDIGLYAKQSAFVFQAKATRSIVEENVFFNAPRAGINLNDGMGGADVIERNLIFNVVRETTDHGVINTWDRQPFLTENGIFMIPRNITRNFLVNSYNPQECVDNDDGSSRYETSYNFLVYGKQGLKNDFGGHSNFHHHNVYAFADRALGVDPTYPGFEDRFVHNKVVLVTDQVGSPQCQPPQTYLANNQYYTFNGTLNECGHDLATWQSISPTSNEPGSTVHPYPPTETIIDWARELLDF